MNKLFVEQLRAIPRKRRERGFTIIEMVVVVAIVGVISTFALMGVTSARAGQRRINSARTLSGYLEKARVDSVRRRAEGTPENPLASVTLVDTNTYRVLLDFNSTGAPVAREFTLEPGVAFAADDIGAVIAFNWRGRTEGARQLEVVNSDHPGDAQFLTSVAVSSFGDVTVNDDGSTPEIETNATNFTAPPPAPTASPLPTETPAPSATPTPEAPPNPSPEPAPDPGG